MDEQGRLLHRLIEDSRSFEHAAGAVTQVTDPHSTGWCSPPCLVTAHVSYAVRYELADRDRMPCVREQEVVLVPPGTRHCLAKTTPPQGQAGADHPSEGRGLLLELPGKALPLARLGRWWGGLRLHGGGSYQALRAYLGPHETGAGSAVSVQVIPRFALS